MSILEQDVVEDGAPGQQRVLLEHHPDVRVPTAHTLALDHHRARRGRDQPHDEHQQLLPQPEGPTIETNSPRPSVDVLKSSVQHTPRRAVDLLDAVETHERSGHPPRVDGARLSSQESAARAISRPSWIT